MDKKFCTAAMALVMCTGLLGGCGSTATTSATTSSAQEQGTTSEAPAAEAPAATETPDPLAGMTLEEKIGQLFVIRPDSLDPSLTAEQIDDAHAEGVTELSASMKESLAKYPVGGIALFRKNIVDPTQLPQLVDALQQESNIPLFVGVDEEGGLVSRLANHPEFETPQYESVASVGDTGDPANAKEMGNTIGGYIKEYGFNLDFAPDADVNTNPDNPVIGTRAFSSDPAVAASMVSACVEGFHDAGVLSCIKHFPGHGDTSTDSHYGCASTEKTWDEMKACEMLPFISGIEAGTDMVMVAHITTPNATTDGLPASLSAEIITDKLRGELGFDGVVITDSLAMEAITDDFTPGESAVLAFKAGADILLMPESLPEAFEAIKAAVESGEISEERLDESVTRIMALKEKLA